MGLFKRLRRNIRRIASDVGQIALQAAPIALGVAGGIGGAQLLGGLFSGAGGSGAIVQSNQFGPPPGIGFVGNQVPSANPIFRAATTPGFDTSRLPARPAFGLAELLRVLQQQQFPQPQPFQQTQQIRQAQFGRPVRPTFRGFTPSFRSGRGQIPVDFPEPTFAAGIPFDPRARQFEALPPQQFPRQFLPQRRGFQRPSFGGFGLTGRPSFGGFGF